MLAWLLVLAKTRRVGILSCGALGCPTFRAASIRTPVRMSGAIPSYVSRCSFAVFAGRLQEPGWAFALQLFGYPAHLSSGVVQPGHAPWVGDLIVCYGAKVRRRFVHLGLSYRWSVRDPVPLVARTASAFGKIEKDLPKKRRCLVGRSSASSPLRVPPQRRTRSRQRPSVPLTRKEALA